ncbi:MAG TPA: hypothetical protein VEX39_00585, partial [Thermoleophilaceae bacterium]|nr:hypothetical protein [Thermoleophilaceae bacterium]
YRETRPRLFAKGEWFFLAVRLDGGAAGRGRYRVRVDRTANKDIELQMAKGTPAARRDVFGLDLAGAVDELAVWQRALSDEELDRLYRAGTDGRPFPGPAVAPELPAKP